MRTFLKVMLPLMLSGGALFSTGCSQVISIQYQKGQLIRSVDKPGVSEISRHTVLALSSPTSVRVYDEVERGTVSEQQFEKIRSETRARARGAFGVAGEIIVRVRFPVPQRAVYEKFPHPASGYAMTGVFIAEAGKAVRVAVTGAASGVFRWAEAESALTRKMDPAVHAGLQLDTSDMNEDIHATREYRANLVRVMAKRAVQKLLAA